LKCTTLEREFNPPLITIIYTRNVKLLVEFSDLSCSIANKITKMSSKDDEYEINCYPKLNSIALRV
jgi:hypothetical protein